MALAWQQLSDVHAHVLVEMHLAPQVCKSCGEEKPAGDFTRYRMRRDGLYNWCKACDIWKRQERRKRKRDEVSYAMPHPLMQVP